MCNIKGTDRFRLCWYCYLEEWCYWFQHFECLDTKLWPWKI